MLLTPVSRKRNTFNLVLLLKSRFDKPILLLQSNFFRFIFLLTSISLISLQDSSSSLIFPVTSRDKLFSEVSRYFNSGSPENETLPPASQSLQFNPINLPVSISHVYCSSFKLSDTFVI